MPSFVSGAALFRRNRGAKFTSTPECALSTETGSISPQYHVVYDELYSSVKGFLTNTVFDEETWDSILSLGGLEQTLEDRDRGNKSVMAPAKDLYKRFVTNDDDTAATNPMSDSDSDCDSVTTISE
jgi:hypothetical protein